MKRFGIFSIFTTTLSLCLICSCTHAGGTTGKDKAIKVAKVWLGTVDQGNYGASWDTAAAVFKKAVTKEQWEAAVTSVRKPLGKMLKRELMGAKPMTDLPKI